MRIDVVTLFPGMVEPVLGASMLGRARARGLVDIRVVNLRDYAEGKHRITDDYQFGGGGGMVLKPEPLFAAVDALRTPEARVILLDPRGRTFTQTVAAEVARATHGILLAGRYEGVDARVNERLADDSISIGDYVLTGGSSNDSSAGRRRTRSSDSAWGRSQQERERAIMDAIRLVEAG